MIDASQPLFVPGEGPTGGRYVTSASFERYGSHQSFALRKPAGVTRVFLLGGSAALGWPLGEECSATGLLRRSLDEVLTGRFEVVNAAVMSFGSHRVLTVAEQVAGLDADVVVVWSGNNEYVERNLSATSSASAPLRRVDRFLGRLHLYRTMRVALRAAAPAFFSAPAGPDLTDPRDNARVVRGERARNPDADREVLENYRRNLEQIVRSLNARGVPVVLCTVPVNLAGWAPQSAPPHFASPREAAEWRALMNEGVDLLDGGDGATAAERFERVLNLTPGYALGSYFLGMARQRLGEVHGAYEAFSEARDRDARVLRALGAFNDAVRQLAAAETGVTLVDLEESFREASGRNLVGADLFLDYCHPTLDGHRVAARSLLPALGRAAGIELPLESLARVVSEADCPPQTDYRRAALAYAVGMTHANNGSLREAETAYREAVRLRPDFTDALANLALLLLRRGATEEAEAISAGALEADPDNVGAMLQLAAIRLAQGRFDEARELGEGVVARTPEYALGWEMLGDVAARQSRWPQAVERYERAVALGWEQFLLRRKLGDAYRALGDTERAREQWRLALEIDPSDAETRTLLDAVGPGEEGGR